jgi:hypothetical protein
MYVQSYFVILFLVLLIYSISVMFLPFVYLSVCIQFYYLVV